MRRYAFYDHGTLSNKFEPTLDQPLPSCKLISISDGGRDIVMHARDIKLVRAYDRNDPDPVAVIVPFNKSVPPITTTTRLGSFTVPLFQISDDQWLPLANVRQVLLSSGGVEVVQTSQAVDPAAECSVLLRNGEAVLANARTCIASIHEHYADAGHLVSHNSPSV